ncbi:hypothetical protein AVEN_187876-1 [Araneus ventricosus]|uniref:Uncharacterized protein n=1 Tax=Araneus ventricosus TaxID=182803 RepID=A0A4Y2CSE4_ARAVE|nr:hypothetical protein AVEN_187876-1 [Araneus ventricosus]
MLRQGGSNSTCGYHSYATGCCPDWGERGLPILTSNESVFCMQWRSDWEARGVWIDAAPFSEDNGGQIYMCISDYFFNLNMTRGRKNIMPLASLYLSLRYLCRSSVRGPTSPRVCARLTDLRDTTAASLRFLALFVIRCPLIIFGRYQLISKTNGRLESLRVVDCKTTRVRRSA